MRAHLDKIIRLHTTSIYFNHSNEECWPAPHGKQKILLGLRAVLSDDRHFPELAQHLIKAKILVVNLCRYSMLYYYLHQVINRF